MDTEQLKSLIDRLEEYARRNPSAYKARVAALAILGYAYLFAIVLLLLLVVFLVVFYVRLNFVIIKVLWIPLVLVGLVLRSLWVTLPEPDGTELSPEDAPKLFGLISEVRSALNGPTVHRVLVSDEFNAGIVQIPRLGMFGWLRNYLVVGLPLMNALTPAEFRAVLAHEFGHLSGNHGRFSGWIYRLRQSWIQVLTNVHQERRYAAFLFEVFLNWYAPFFNAYSFVLARAQEYEADGYSAELAGRETAARALIRISTKGKSIQEEFWPAFYRQSHDEAQPPKDPFAQMLTGLNRSIDRPTAEKWFLQELQVTTGYEDTHPCLGDRLAAMGYKVEGLKDGDVNESLLETTAAGEQTAAEYYFETLPDEFIATCNRRWKEQISEVWRERHKFIQEKRARLTELEAKSTSEPLTVEEQWEYASCLGEIKDSKAAATVLKELIARDPTHIGANYALGAILLEEEDAAGIELLEKAVQLDPSITGDAFHLIYQFLRNQGRQTDAEIYRSRAAGYFEEQQKYEQQALNFTYRDTFEPHDLDANQTAELRNVLRNIRIVETAYLVKKILPDAPQQPYVLGVVPLGEDPELLNELAAKINFSSMLIFVLLTGKHKFLQPMFASIKGAQVFPAE